ncbi:retroviral-like aspartic protease family protein [Paraburkholderia bannensis]|uniref:retroviral-like aspartic protease family protein n=1 Tax=Paraburkholderia bannensis TaxID=765414 RepID=UPI002AC34BF4|nr:retroviral-like aspartic protease family protein [Paraburkholderia bannensis]
MKNKIRLPVLLGVVSVCALPLPLFAQQAAETPANSCELHVDATLPLAESEGRFFVNVEINGVEQAMLVDTSSLKTALTPEAADALKLPLDMSSAQTLTGIGTQGEPTYPRVLTSLKLGPTQWRDLRVPMFAAHAFSTHGGIVPAGVLGANVLSRYDVELDFPRHTMTLYTAQNCLGRFAPWHGDYQSYSPIYTSEHRFIMQMALNRHPILAMLDTGATPSLVSRSGAQRASLDTNAFQQDPQRTGFGLNGTAVAFYIHRFDTVQIGAREFQNVKLEVSDAPFYADMLLGMDFLKWRRVWLSYSTGWVFMQLHTASAQPSSHKTAEWANAPGTEQTAAIINEGGATPPVPIAQFSTHSHMTYTRVPQIVQQSRLAPPPTGMVPLSAMPSFVRP